LGLKQKEQKGTTTHKLDHDFKTTKNRKRGGWGLGEYDEWGDPPLLTGFGPKVKKQKNIHNGKMRWGP